MAVVVVLIVCHLLLLLPYLSYSLPLCTNSRTPFTLQSPLAFCSYNGTACCNSAEDTQLQKQFMSMNVSDPSCASAVKSILCARCDPYSAELFTTKSVPRTIPVLCNSTVSVGSTQSKAAGDDFCAKVWDTCQKVSVRNSPFAPSLQGKVGVPVNSSIAQLTDLWQSKSDFCDAFGGPSSDGSVCFSGDVVTLNTTGPPSLPSGLCLEKIGNGSYLNMVPHPDGSDRVFLGNQEGKIWLATVPKEGSSEVLGFDESDPFVDLTDEVHFETTFGMMGMAFHPDFARNGRFFASYNCDKSQSPRCSGRCSCNSDVNCDPSKLPPEEGAQPCRYQSVISEFTANGSATDGSSVKTSANPTEVRRIFTMGLPFTGHHAGQILFGPEDGYMYFMMGDGGSRGDPYKFAQNKKSLLGKIMRLDINNIPSAKEISDLGLWGNYSIPKDNPSVEDKELQPEIWTLGMRNPWRCSFDSERPSYFICADVGQETYEEVDLITKGGNYGWSVYEGRSLYQSPNSSTTNASLIPSDTIFPVLGYTHAEVNKNEGSASITGGYVYRSTTDPCMQGRYLYADLYAHYLWAADEFPENSGKFNSTLIPFSCAADSPIQCTSLPGSTLPNLGYIYSFGEDNRKDVMLLTSSGVYRVVRPSRCNYLCSKENATATSPGPGSSPAPSSANTIRGIKDLVLLFSCFSLILPVFFM